MENKWFEKKSSEVAALIAKSGDVVNFGTAKNRVSNARLQESEESIGFRFTRSYKWFLQNYAGGEICGDEILSVYARSSSETGGGDIAFHYVNDAKIVQGKLSRVRVFSTDFGERFFFDYARFDGKEAPVCLALGDDVSEYAADFFEFLIKRIEACG